MTASDLRSELGVRAPAGRLRRFGLLVWRRTVGGPIAEGRLRDDGWPYGLRSSVVIGYLMFGLAGVAVLASGPVRAVSPLILSNANGEVVPAALVWPFVVLVSFGTAALLAGSLHGPWWLTALGVVFVTVIGATWTAVAAIAAGVGWGIGLGALLLAAATFAVVRHRRVYAWWELPVCWLLVSTVMVVGLVANRAAAASGTDFGPQMLQVTAQVLDVLAQPAAMVAGASVAELTVRAATAATEGAQRLPGRRWPYLVLGIAVALTIALQVRKVANLDRVTQGWVAVGWAVAVVSLLAAGGLAVVRVARRRGGHPEVTEVPDQVGGLGFRVAGILLLIQVPVQLFVVVLLFLPRSAAGGSALSSLTPLVGNLIDPERAIVGVILVILGVRAARRGEATRALVMTTIGIVLAVHARRLIAGDRAPLTLDFDLLNLVVSMLVVAAIAGALVRRRLDRQRACAYAGLLVLSALVSNRDFVSDPVGSLLGYSGAALVLFGVTWDLLTGSGWGNGESARFPRPTRVLLVLTNSILTLTVLAYAAMIRDSSQTVHVDAFAQFGDVVFGTALLAAAVVALFDSIGRRDGRVSTDPSPDLIAR